MKTVTILFVVLTMVFTQLAYCGGTVCSFCRRDVCQPGCPQYRGAAPSQPAKPVFVSDPGSVMALGIIGAGLQDLLSPEKVSPQEQLLQQQAAAALEAENQRKNQLEEQKRQAARKFLDGLDRPVVDFKKDDPTMETLKPFAVPELGRESPQSGRGTTVPELSLPLIPCGYVEESKNKAIEFVKDLPLQKLADKTGVTWLKEDIDRAKANLDRLRNVSLKLAKYGLDGVNQAARVLGSSGNGGRELGSKLEEDLYKNADDVKSGAGEGIEAELNK